ncbi:MAG TPA: hypothetical protein IAC24_00110 [Candidatus Onthousia faecigallinarum]|nr:hypothetical protein [Candidatus Onthousia faecigallinarum]
MEVEFKDNDSFSLVKDVFIRDGNKLLKIFYGANGDLYFDIFGCRNKSGNDLYTAVFTIKQYEEIYQYFEQLVKSIIDCEVFDMVDIESELSDFDNGVADKINYVSNRNEELKTKQAYKKLVYNNTIIWYSDNIYDESANILQIERNCEEIKLTFTDNPADPSFGFGIRICNSGSKYDPFNICFMNLFNQLQLLSKNDLMKKLVKTEKSCR